MTFARPVVAHALLALSGALVAGCADSHGRDVDSGSVPIDAGRPIDGGAPLDAPPVLDAFPTGDAGAARSCEPDDARSEICPELLCDGPGTWHWNGDACFWIDCGACEGEDCGHSWSSEGECLAAHATCEATLCRGTGGTWLFWAEECEHFSCGRALPAACIVGRPVCDCGPFAEFDPINGCVEADCPELPPPPRPELCTSTGGSWEEGICCDTTCGAYCELACAGPGCNCGRGRVMDDLRGCIEATECFERTRGESCDVRSRCEAGTICCDRCGGAGCSGSPTCVDPTCDVDPHTDSCGNRDDVP